MAATRSGNFAFFATKSVSEFTLTPGLAAVDARPPRPFPAGARFLGGLGQALVWQSVDWRRRNRRFLLGQRLLASIMPPPVLSRVLSPFVSSISP